MKLLVLIALSFTAGAQYSIDSVIDNLIRVESSGDDKAIGDSGRAVGCLQLWKIHVDDVNRICKLKNYPYQFAYSDRYDRKKSKLMARIFFRYIIERYKVNKGRLPNEYELAHQWKWPYQYRVFDWKYINQYKTKQKV